MQRKGSMVVLLMLLVFLNLKLAASSAIILPETYSIHKVPLQDGAGAANGDPLNVTFSINLRNVLDVNEVQQLLSLETTLRMFWKDIRLRGTSMAPPEEEDYVAYHPSVASKLWIPDIFIDQAKAVRKPAYQVEPTSIRVYKDLTVRYSSRFNFDVACQMNFRRYPVDEQVCEIKLESFGHTSKQLKFSWASKDNNNINPNISLSQFKVDVSFEDTYDTDYYDLKYPGVIIRIKLKRNIGYHFVQTYIPSMVFVCLAWLSLFIPADSVPGRVGMSMTTILTLTAMFSAVRQNVPKVSYISNLDIWMITCIFFVSSTIVEFAVVTNLLKRGHKNLAETLERTAKLLLPLFFLLFNCIYWPVIFSA